MTDASQAGPPLSPDQSALLTAFDAFLADDRMRAFVLSGAAGTGKTTLLGPMIRAAERAHRSWRLTALTGRAALVARRRTSYPAQTVHSFLYRFDSRASKVLDGIPKLVFATRNPADDPVSVLFVDEASLLGAASQGDLGMLWFGSGNLVVDLLHHLFQRSSSPGAAPKLVLIGDPFQLPPVGDRLSIAFDAGAWKDLSTETLGAPLPTIRCELTHIHRHTLDGGILGLATKYRDALVSGDFRTTPLPPTTDQEATVMGSDHLVQRRIARAAAAKPTESVVVTHTNVAARSWNRLVRQERWGDADEPLHPGDLLMNARPNPRTGFENGEILEVVEVTAITETVRRLGREVHLRPVVLRRLGDDTTEDCLVADAALDSDEPSLNPLDLQVLWVDFRSRHSHIKDGSPEYWEAAFRDRLLNPIVAKFGHAVTAHKAQGGQWPNVVVDFPSMMMAPDDADGFRWAYTAVTRASHRLILVDPPRRSVFSRLAPTRTEPVAGSSPTGVVAGEAEPSDVLRRRFDLAIEEWAARQGTELARIKTAQTLSRISASKGAATVMFDAHFKADGRLSKVLVVGRPTGDERRLVPSVRSIERVVYRSSPRPSDPRVAEALQHVESALRAAGLPVMYRRAMDWSVELEIGDDDAGGVLLLDHRKTGVLSGYRWVQRPAPEMEMAVERVLGVLASG